LYEINGSR
jgi:hypothetical protein